MNKKFVQVGLLRKVVPFVLALSMLATSVACSDSGSASSAGTSGGSSAAAASSGSSSAKKDGFVLAYANGYIGNTWRAQFVDDITQICEQYKSKGVLKDYQIANSNNDVNQQLNQINSMINSGVDAILVDPVSPTSLGPVIKKAQQKGILFLVSNDIAAYNDVYAVGSNLNTRWSIMTTWLAQAIGEKGNIIELDGVAGNSSDNQNINAAKSVLKKYPNIKVLAQTPGNWSQSEGQKLMTTYLSTYNNIDGVLCQDGEPEGVIKAYENAGKTLVPIAGDYTKSFLDYWASHPALESCSVTSVPSIGATSVMIAVGLLQGKKLKTDSVNSNPLNASMNNFISVYPAGVITRDGDKNAKFLQEFIKEYPSLKVMSVKEALNECEGKASTYNYDIMMTQDEVDQLFQ